jgi:hypothetical protein
MASPGWHRETLGDLVHDERWLLASRLPILGWRWRVGAPRDTVPAGPQPTGPLAPSNGRTDVTMDLKADQQVTLSGSYIDEAGNPVDAPAGATVVYTVDDPTSVTLTDLGDGTAVAAATGVLGTADVHAEADLGNGRTASGDLQIVVVAGDAERFAIVAGDPTEVTPDV